MPTIHYHGRSGSCDPRLQPPKPNPRHNQGRIGKERTEFHNTTHQTPLVARSQQIIISYDHIKFEN
jgi:hypothetical protein